MVAQPQEISFEFDADDRTYTHDHLLEVDDAVDVDDVIEQAGGDEIRQAIEQQFAQGGIEGVEVDTNLEKIDDSTVHVTSQVTAPEDTDATLFARAACSSESIQLLLTAIQADPANAGAMVKQMQTILAGIAGPQQPPQHTAEAPEGVGVDPDNLNDHNESFNRAFGNDDVAPDDDRE